MSEEETITVAALLDGQHHGTTSVVFTHVAGGKMRHFIFMNISTSCPAFISDKKKIQGNHLTKLLGCGKLLAREEAFLICEITNFEKMTDPDLMHNMTLNPT
jgi:hypothetical protein